MIEKDYQEFKLELEAAVELIDYRARISGGAMRMWWSSLRPYPLDVVLFAINSHVAKSKFIPKPADIIEIISCQDGRPDENEAWAMSLASQDEGETVIWSNEMSQAFAVASKILITGDQQGAKMAFREVYSKLVAKARQCLEPVQWRVSLGHDRSRVNDAINQAVIDKKISNEIARQYLIDSSTKEGQAIVGLITGKVVDIKSINRERLAKLKTVIETKKSHEEIAAEKRKAKEAERRDMIEAAKKQTAKYVEEKIKNTSLDETA